MAAAYGSWAYLTGAQPFCSTDSNFYPCNYSYAFTVFLHYRGSWQALYYGYHGAMDGVFSSNYSFTKGSFGGVGNATESITLRGPDNEGLGICVLAVKLDGSGNNITVGIGLESTGQPYPGMTNSTNLPSGSTYICGGVYP